MESVSADVFEYIPDSNFQVGVSKENNVLEADKNVDVIDVSFAEIKNTLNSKGIFATKFTNFDLLNDDESRGYTSCISFRDRPLPDRLRLIKTELKAIKLEIDESSENKHMLDEFTSANNQLSELYTSALQKFAKIEEPSADNKKEVNVGSVGEMTKNCKYELYIDPSRNFGRDIIERISALSLRINQLNEAIGESEPTENLQKKVADLKSKMEIISRESISSLENNLRDYMNLLLRFNNSAINTDRIEAVYKESQFIKKILHSLPYIVSQLKYLHNMNIGGIELIEGLGDIKNNQEFCSQRLEILQNIQNELKKSIVENKEIFSQNMQKLLERK